MDMKILRRGCVRHDESIEALKNELGIEMEVFKNYSRTTCLLECRARHLTDLCGCLPYYYPDFGLAWGIDTTCDVDGLKCLADNPSKYENAI